MNTFARLAFLALVLASCGAVSAQHAKFVLFGDGFKGQEPADFKPEHRFVHPVSSPYFHEDSFVTSDVRLYALYHKFPSGGVLNGGDAQVYAAQVRVALTDKIQLVAYKDGYTDMDSGLIDDSGFNDIAAGLKWNFLQDWKNQLHLAVGAGYELALGDPSILHNNDEFRFWASANKGFDRLHLGITGNLFVPCDDDSALGESVYASWHLHADYYVCKHFSPTIELNGYHVIDEANEVVPISGIDVTNLGGGDDVITMAIGGEIRPCSGFAVRAAYEFPLTDGEDIYGYRLTFSAVLSF